MPSACSPSGRNWPMAPRSSSPGCRSMIAATPSPASEISLRYSTDPNELRSAIASAIEEADRLAELAEDLLVVARSEDGALALHVEPVQLSSLLEELRERFRAQAGAAGRAVAVDADGA